MVAPVGVELPVAVAVVVGVLPGAMSVVAAFHEIMDAPLPLAAC